MKKALAIFLTVLLMGNISASALWKFEVTERICVGKGEVSFTDYSEGGMSLMAEGVTFEETILAGWADLSAKIDVKAFRIKEEELLGRYSEVLYENPKYYFIGNRYGYRYNTEDDGNYITAILPTYTETDKSAIEDIWAQIDEEINNILLYIERDMTDFEKVSAVHDYMVLHYDYDHSTENENHTITIMTTKTGVCESYALAFNYIMNIVGIESVMVTSEEMVHAWNLVKVDGKWYHVDVTWDDTERPDQVGHQFELLSDKKIQELEDPHYGYNTGGLVADSDLYDDAEWHDNHSQVVSVRGAIYWVKGNTLVNNKGDVVCAALDGDDGYWSIGDGYAFSGSVYTGLASFGGKLYYNTDKAIFAYNPKTKQSVKVKDVDGACGIHIDGNKLKYGKYDRDAVIIVNGEEYKGDFYEAEEVIKLSGARITVPYIKNGKAVAKIYTDATEKVNIMSFGKNGAGKAIAEKGITSVEIDTDSFDYIYFLDDKLNPLHDKVKISE